jgi:hypothetical protein
MAAEIREGPTVRAFAAVALAVAFRPDLWWTALGSLRRMAAPGWWRSRPYLPLPDAGWWQFRMVTAYGRPDAVPVGSDVVSYLEWSRSTAPIGPSRAAPWVGGRQDTSRSG